MNRFGAYLLFGCMAVSCLAAPASLESILSPIVEKTGLPALAAAVVRSNSVIAAGAVGVRKIGGTEAVTLQDKFHLGSCTKSMTATLAAMFVEQEHLSWNETIGGTFTNWTDIDPGYAGVTLKQLLCHRGGLPGDLTRLPVWAHVWSRSRMPPAEQRIALARELLSQKPAVKPGTRFLYANAGYTVVGAMIEQREHRPWEELITERLFRPLQMDSAGFGAPATPGKVDQPWGHVLRNGKPVPIPPGPSSDNPAAIGPGGTVHCSILDFAAYANFHLQGARGHGTLLKPETFKKLHTPPPGGDYALGWGVASRPWAKGRALTHVGSNTMNTAIVWIAPDVDFAVVIVTNLGGKEAEIACDTVASQIIDHFLKW